MKNKWILLTALISFTVFSAAFSAETTNVNGVDFKFSTDKSVLEITLDKEVKIDAEKIDNDADKQVVIEIKNARLAKKLERKLDTSSFDGNVVLISPYQSGPDVRVVLQLKEPGGVVMDNSSGKILVSIDNKSADKKEPEIAGTQPKPEDKSEEKSNETVDQLVDALETKQYNGKKITLQLQSVDILDVFKVISEASDINIIVTEDVKGKVSLNLTEVPWDQALDILLKSNKLAAEKNGNVLRIATLDSMIKEKQTEVNAKKVVESAEPLVVKIFPISYAKLDELKGIVKDFLSKESGLDGKDTGTRGSLQTDNRTNALIVRDTPTSIEKIKRIIKELDTQTPQILIEAKFVEVSESKNREVAGKLFLSTREFQASTSTLSFNGARGNAGGVFGGKSMGAATSLPTAFSITPTAGAAFGFSPKTTGILPPGLRDISAFLSILESETSAKVIASPRIVTQNKEAAEISQGKAMQLATIGGVGSTGGYQTVNAVLKLSVTPQVTSDGSINVKLNFSQDSIADAISGATIATNTKKVDTTVLVESGATLVIGGIYTSTAREGKYGIPFLRDLPLLGWLFGSKDTLQEKGELFIFVTPRIINAKEAGIQG